MFRGVNNLSIDSKGRLAVPSRYREHLHESCQGQIVITIDTTERCLLIYPAPHWELIERQIGELPNFNHQARRVQRLLIGHATEGQLDGNGRFIVPPPLREYANLSKQIVLIGQGRKFELWDASHWEVSRDNWLQNQTTIDEAVPPGLLNISL